MFMSNCRKPVDTFAPPLGRLYRSMRDATNRRHPVPTQHGFALAGDPSMTKPGWEAEETEAFLGLLSTHDVVLDIGANVGFYSCLAASRKKQTIAFEPSPRNLKFLYMNLWNNGFSDVEVFPLGLAGRRGLGRIYGFGGIASFVPGWAQAREAQSCLVPLTTLDTILAGRFKGAKLLIKMDVEGFELDVLSGAQDTLHSATPATWLVEVLLRDGVIPGGVSDKFSKVFDLFWSCGYRSTMLDAARTRVERADVARWVKHAVIEGEAHDFLFSAD